MSAHDPSLRQPPVAHWDHAPAAIASLLNARGGVESTGGRVVGVTGPVGAGKSTLAGLLSRCVVSTDRYLPDYDSVPYERRDEPEAADLDRLARDLASLASGVPTLVPVWSFQTHRREGEELIVPPPPGMPIVCEGLHALHTPAVNAMHLRVFVEAPSTVRWARWEHLETTGVRGWGPVVAREFFDRVAEPTFARWADALRASSDLVVING